MDTRLSSVLDNAGIAYAKRVSDRGVAYAGFRWTKGESSDGLLATAIIEHDVLRITVHNVNTASEPMRISRSVAKLPLGKVYISPTNGQVEVSLGLYIGKLASLSPMALLALLHYLDDARHYIEGQRVNPSIPVLSSIPTRNGQDIIPLLRGYGHKFLSIDNGAMVELKLQEELGCHIEIYERPDAWYVVHAHYLPAVQIALSQKELSLIQQLQHWATAGRFVFGDSGELYAEVLTPNLGQPPKEMISWTISQSMALLQVAAKQLGLPQSL